MQEVLYMTFGNMVSSATKVQAQISSRYSCLLASLISFYTVQCHVASFSSKVIILFCIDISLGVAVEWGPSCLTSQIIGFNVGSTIQAYPKFALTQYLHYKKKNKIDHAEPVTET
jgi:hypothetical protein